MKIIAIIGSPRGRGNTFGLVERVVSNLITIDPLLEYEYVFLSEKRFDNCIGCQKCLTHGEQMCPVKDDMALIKEKMDAADGIILASPVYAAGAPAIFKTFIDRHAYLIHRPRYFDTAFLNIVTDGISGYKSVIKQMMHIVSGGKFAGNLHIKNAPVPMKNARVKTIKKINHASIRFYRELRSMKRHLPSLYDFGWFYTFKTLSQNPVYQYYYPANQAYYHDKKNYFYDIKGHLFKKMFGKMMGFMMRRSLMFQYDLKTNDATLNVHKKNFHEWLDKENDLD